MKQSKVLTTDLERGRAVIQHQKVAKKTVLLVTIVYK